MLTDILDDARSYLTHALKGKVNPFETKHPWRIDWKFTVLHAFRVESYALKILARQPGHPLSEHEILLLRLAAILHDVSRLDHPDLHAREGAELARAWLQNRADPLLHGNDLERVVEMIADHSNKRVAEPDFINAVLKDADTLDEIGAMSIFMAGNWLQRDSAFFFHDLRQRLVNVELPFCDRQMGILNTAGAREILREKKAFVENFIDQLSDEILTDGTDERMLLALSQNGE